MWQEKLFRSTRLVDAVAACIMETPQLSDLYKNGKREDCYREMMKLYDTDIQDRIQRWENMKQKLQTLGLLPDKREETFCDWIRAAVQNPDPNKLEDYEKIVEDAFINVFANDLGEDFMVLEFWGMEYDDSVTVVPYDEELRWVISHLYEDHAEEITKLLQKK